jgi:thiosulfate dehydrogenase (quinone) large subunit
MNNYINNVKAEMKNPITAIMVLLFTVARVIYGLAWIEAASHKLTWFTDGKLNSAGLIGKMANNIAGPQVTSFDPLYINKFFGWVANTVFIGMPNLTDYLVVTFELAVGIAMVLGFRVFWTALLATFMNIQFIASGSFNNFGYIWTNLAFMNFTRYAELIGISALLKAKKNGDAIQTGKFEYAGK